MVDYDKLNAIRRLDLEITRFNDEHDVIGNLGDSERMKKVLKLYIPLLQQYLMLLESLTEEEEMVFKNYGYHHVDPSWEKGDWD